MTAPVIARGSAFAFSCREQERECLLDSLAGLLRKGMGLRRHEGFGRVSFCDPFHLQRRTQS